MTSLGINGLALNYTVDYGASTQGYSSSFNGTFFECTFDPLSAPPGLGANTKIKEYGYTTLGIPVGWFGYIGDWFSHGFSQLQALTTLISYFLTPANFDVLGYTLADLTGVGVMLLIGMYVFCYVPIVIFVYKAISPLAGGF